MVAISLSHKEQTGANGNDEPIFEGTPFECRLMFHGRGQNVSQPTIVKNRSDLRKGDVFVINLDEKQTQKLLMQVDEARSGLQGASAEIQIDDSIRKTFNLSSLTRQSYTIEKVAKREAFALYLVEVQVKEQYFSRGDMWRFTRRLVDTTVYLKKSIDIFGMRATVYGLWVDSSPYRVSSGYITKDTKIVFRSLSAFCTIFLQMSKEMWDFDHHGDTYYEKAVDGFLFDLFTRWKNMSCQHDVTMTLFSRVFYDAQSLDDFPLHLRNDINKDHAGRFYEDFYRVIYQNERYDDWLPRLAKIKQVLVTYKEDLITYHKRQLPPDQADQMPNATISSAMDGNFLETLNLSASVFERQYIDRPFDRLGQMSVIITPGAGVFEIDRGLANMTKQRVLDNGIGSDLVCLGEQPLFAVPLFKFIKTNPNAADDYQIPHWINLSYYHSSTVPSCFKSYVPRLPFDVSRILDGPLDVKILMNSISENTFTKPPQLSMEEYDYQIFRSAAKMITKDGEDDQSSKHANASSRRRYVTMGPSKSKPNEEDEPAIQERGGLMIVNQRLPIDPSLYNQFIKDDSTISTSHFASTSITSNYQMNYAYNQVNQLLSMNTMRSSRLAQSAQTYFLSRHSSAHSQTRPKALQNPFAPASISIPMVPSRRRWAHTFPMGPNKLPWHFHHLRKTEGAAKTKLRLSVKHEADHFLPGTTKRIVSGLISKHSRYHTKLYGDTSAKQKRILSPSSFEAKRDQQNGRTERKGSFINGIGMAAKKVTFDPMTRPPTFKKKKEAIIWGPTGVEPWSASMITGIDWKSLTIPASLPTTFDVVPSADELQRDYHQNCYTLIHDLSPKYQYDPRRRNQQNEHQPVDKATEDMERQKIIFEEFIDHRLSQGFQMIVEMPNHIEQKMQDSIRRTSYQPSDCNRLLSIGRIYHTVSLVKDENPNQDTVVIYVQQYKPQYAYDLPSMDYKYRRQSPDSSDYDASHHLLKVESLEAFSWNTVDNVVINHGAGGSRLSDTTRYWHTRLVIMPVSKDYTIRSIESGQTKCDSRQEMTPEDYFLYVEHFVRFLFMLNKLARVRSWNGMTHFIHRPLDPVTGKKRTNPPRRQGKHAPKIQTFQFAPIQAKDDEAMKNLVNLMRDDHHGLLFVKDAELPEYSFIAIEAIWWSIERGKDIDHEQTAVSMFQMLFERGTIRHCTNIEKSFRFGFFLYYIVTEKSKNFYLDSNDYAEVEFYRTQTYIPSMDYLGFGLCKPMRLLPNLIATQSTLPRANRTSAAAAGMNVPAAPPNTSSSTTSSAIVLKRDCNVDVDPNGVSDRREWASANYHSFYNPHCLFELEIRWLVATSSMLGNLITQWSHRTGMITGSHPVAFHLVPIPCDPFAEFDALRGPIYINMNSSCIRDKLAHLSDRDQIFRLNIFQELILKRYGFILNACVSYSNEKIYHVHISGGMLVYIISDVYNVRYNRQSTRINSSDSKGNGQNSPFDCGFYWCWNFCLGKRWRSSQTGEEKYQDIMLADFRAFCANDKDRLVHFWNEVNDMANKKMAEQPGEVSIEGDSQR